MGEDGSAQQKNKTPTHRDTHKRKCSDSQMGGPWIDLTVPVAPPFLMRQPAPLGAPTGMAHTEWCQISFAVERHGGTSAATYFNGCPGQAMTLRKGMQVDAKNASTSASFNYKSTSALFNYKQL
jgi:hypothetical protein